MLDKQLTPIYPTFSYDMRDEQVQVRLDFIQGNIPTRTIRIWGQILDESGQPMPFTMLYLYRYLADSTTYELVSTTFTDGNGWYSLQVDDHRVPVCYTLVPYTEAKCTRENVYECGCKKVNENTNEDICNSACRDTYDEGCNCTCKKNQNIFGEMCNSMHDEETSNIHSTLYVAQNKPFCEK